MKPEINIVTEMNITTREHDYYSIITLTSFEFTDSIGNDGEASSAIDTFSGIASEGIAGIGGSPLSWSLLCCFSKHFLVSCCKNITFKSANTLRE